MSVSVFLEGQKMVFASFPDPSAPFGESFIIRCSLACVFDVFGLDAEYFYNGSRNDESCNTGIALYNDGKKCPCGETLDCSFTYESGNLYEEL